LFEQCYREFVSAEARAAGAVGYAPLDEIRNVPQQAVACRVPMNVVDLLKVIQVDYEQGSRVTGGGATFGSCSDERPAIVKASCIILEGERLRHTFALAPRFDFRFQVTAPTPSDKYKRDVEQQGHCQCPVRAKPEPGKCLKGLGKSYAARRHEDDHGGECDSDRDQVGSRTGKGALG
jgi:hypothetical protein